MPRVIFVDPEGKHHEMMVPSGMTLLEVTRLCHDEKICRTCSGECNIYLEGACDGALACSTCHVILEKNFFDSLSPPSEDEEDMLDLAFGLKATSRLGCQVVLDDSMDGIVIHLPRNTRNVSL